MRIFLTAAFALTLFASCNDGKADKSSGMEALNEQSKECIRTMNKAEEGKNAALASGDAALAAVFQKTMDSAARENVMIAQKMSELNSK